MADNRFQFVPIEKIIWQKQERETFDPEVMAALERRVIRIHRHAQLSARTARRESKKSNTRRFGAR